MVFKSKYKFWLSACIIVAILFSLSGFSLAFESAYTIQDDARQHVFWLQKLNDPALFSNDLIADYFSSVAPVGYKTLYQLANLIGLKPFLFNKILPLFLGVASSIYIFLVTLEIFPVPFAGFLASLLLNQNLWLLDDLVSGTPRAFFYVLFLGFVYYLLSKKLLLCLLFIVLQGLFYPQVVLISAGLLFLRLITQKQRQYFYLIGLTVAISILIMYKLQTAEFNQVISLKTAQQMLEFYPEGRNAFFADNHWYFWLAGARSGFFPREWQYTLLCSFGLLLPILIDYSSQFSLARKINQKVEIIGQILLASFGLFCLSHLLLFELHLPSRYSQHTWRIVIALVDGITIAVVLNWLTRKITQYQKILRPLIVAIAIVTLLYPTYAVQSYPYRLGYVTGKATELYQFLQQQPKDSLIATLSSEADFIPSLAQRSVLVASEYSIPYHLDYYQPFSQRTKDLIQAQYSSSQAELERFIQQYQIDLWLIDQNAFTIPYLKDNLWLKQFQPEADRAIASIQQKQPLIVSKLDRCSIFQTAELNLLDTKCIVKYD
ncbi:hypothetical protein IQ255_24405 [Pleurocapsales cyanobacterium LEGE 10410]|nr:hypothetical protein [Pleurocapsales cyanobacterium LEGE 10410]